jgi:hypothetical protein
MGKGLSEALPAGSALTNPEAFLRSGWEGANLSSQTILFIWLKPDTMPVLRRPFSTRI